MSQEATYFTPTGNPPPQTAMITSRAVVRPTYAIIPASSITDGVRSNLPGWREARCWVLATPAIGFATAFAQYLIYLDSEGGSDAPEFEAGVESFLFVPHGEIHLSLGKTAKPDHLKRGGFAFIPADTSWAISNTGKGTSKFIWLRKAFEPFGNLRPAPIVNHEQEVPVVYNPISNQKWTTDLIPTNDMAYDMHMNIVSFGPGTTIAAVEAHIMEHGLYMLQGKGMYLLNDNWHEVEAGDFIWMRAFCPQAYYAGGPMPTRYLLYKNMNRQFRLTPT